MSVFNALSAVEIEQKPKETECCISLVADTSFKSCFADPNMQASAFKSATFSLPLDITLLSIYNSVHPLRVRISIYHNK